MCVGSPETLMSVGGFTPLKFLLSMKYIILLFILASCTTRQIAHTPTRREINKAMRYSTSEYIQPTIRIEYKTH